jgi:hypothetical protein
MSLNLIQTCFRFEDDNLFALDTPDFERLLGEGRLAWPLKNVLTPPEVGLAYDGDAGDFSFVFEPDADLDLFLDRARLVTFLREPTPALVLAEAPPLRQLLLRALPAVKSSLPQQRLGEQRRWWRMGQSAPFPATVLTSRAKTAIRRKGSFYGMAGICRCGEPGCASSYGWVEEHVVLLAIEKDGSHWEVCLFPCRFAA